MPQNEYKVISNQNTAVLNQELTQLAMKGWTPILLSTAVGGGEKLTLTTTIVLEHKPGA
ncbi:MAG: hypothetical protein NVS1B11_10200 [Terriglobales bacterium]